MVKILSLIFILIPIVAWSDQSSVSFDAPLTLYRLNKHGVLTDPIFLKPNTVVHLDTIGKASDTDLEITIKNWENTKIEPYSNFYKIPSLIWPSRPNGILHVPVMYDGKKYVARINQLVNEKKYTIHNSNKSEHLLRGASSDTPTEARLPSIVNGRPCMNCTSIMDGQQQPLTASQRAAMEEFLRESASERMGHTSPTPLNQKYIPLAEDYNKSCHNFIKPDGTLGPFGEAIVKELDRPEYMGLFFDHPQISNDCPNYAGFTKAQKQNYIINFFTHLSWLEST